MFQNNQPIAESLRPQNFDEYLGQKHLVGENGLIRKLLNNQTITSMILWGPPGTGKTTLALLIAEMFSMNFFQLSAVNSGVKEVRQVIDHATLKGGGILFIDEIHRFNKSQQDSLLNAVEKGIVTLIGATTENPSFEVISPLLSRCQVFTLHPLNEDDLFSIAQKTLEFIKSKYNLTIEIKETQTLFSFSGGDARKLINLIELIVFSNQNTQNLTIDNALIKEILKKRTGLYDKSGEYHYDIISAFIKSLRGSDPHAALYWMARMLIGGEDPLFIARRMLVLASEDIGNANPTAMVIANNCFDAVHKIGMPEARIILSQTAIYLATSAKSNSAYLAIEKAYQLAEKTLDLPVPLHLRNAPTKLMKDLQYGMGYLYAHDYKNNFILQEFLPEKISGSILYEPQSNQREIDAKKRLEQLWGDKYKSTF